MQHIEHYQTIDIKRCIKYLNKNGALNAALLQRWFKVTPSESFKILTCIVRGFENVKRTSASKVVLIDDDILNEKKVRKKRLSKYKDVTKP